jgi:putative glycerol-1-phosphate prenyltransferase
MSNILEDILFLKRNNRKAIAILIDPDNLSRKLLTQQVELAKINSIDFFFIGGSMIAEDCLEETLDYIKSNCEIPAIIFPGSVNQVSDKADAILFLSLISGRNSDLLIGNHVLSAPIIKKAGIEVIPTGYMLIDGGKPTAASYMSNSFPIPNDKPKIAEFTALAGEMLGLRLNFLDAGSGAAKKVSKEMIRATSEGTTNPLIVGGGIKTAESAKEAWDSGATIVVIGNAIETDPKIIEEVSKIKFT